MWASRREKKSGTNEVGARWAGQAGCVESDSASQAYCQNRWPVTRRCCRPCPPPSPLSLVPHTYNPADRSIRPAMDRKRKWDEPQSQSPQPGAPAPPDHKAVKLEDGASPHASGGQGPDQKAAEAAGECACSSSCGDSGCCWRTSGRVSRSRRVWWDSRRAEGDACMAQWGT